VRTAGRRVHQRHAESRTAVPEQGLRVAIISFGFKYGTPRDADLVLDVRFLPNPYWEPELKQLAGTDEPRPRVRHRATPLP